MEQYNQTFPELDIVGWYATGSTITATDMEAHRKLMDINESPVFLLLDANLKTQTKGNMLPITLYESELHVQDGTPVFHFVLSDFTIATSEAERIGVDQVARIVPSTGSFAGSTQLTSQLNSMHSAVTMLVDRVAALHALLIKMQSGEVPFDHEIVRHAAALSARLPAMDSQQFETSYNAQVNDILITILLASLTKVNASQSELIEKSNDAFQRISSMIKRGGKGTAPQPAERMGGSGSGGHHYHGKSGMMML
jgi:COP9 signalosome complex subunit 6